MKHAHALVAEMAADPWGQVSPSVYETARVVSLAPDLPGHDARLRFLLDTQHPAGWWGGPDGYALVPTLSATEALLHNMSRKDAADAAARGLRALRQGQAPLVGEPDTPARDLIVPALSEAIFGHLAAVDGALPLPYTDGGRLAKTRAALAAGHPPGKLAHVWEIVATTAADPPRHRLPGPLTCVGASPAASAAAPMSDDVRRYLVAVIDRYGGAVPCATPIAVFVHAWALSWLARAGLDLAGPALTRLLGTLTAEFGPAGTAAGPGLPPDADTTAVVLDTLARLGRPREPDCLWAYDLGTHFCTWPGEDGASATVNAHVLDAFGSYLRRGGSPRHRYADAVRRITAWLCDQQESDGSWDDRWHASPYYATVCCALALAESGGTQAQGAVARAVAWVVRTQHDDGSWGRWEGTAEETAYALHVLALGDAAGDALGDARDALGDALTRGRRFLAAAGNGEDQPALWHDKDLYRPDPIVAAVTLAALSAER